MKKHLRMSGIILLLLCMLLCSVTGSAAEKKVKLNKSEVTVQKGGTVQLKLKNASGKVKWTSSKKTVATVSSSGKVTGKNAGTCEVTAVYRKKAYTCKVKITRSAPEQMAAKYPAKKYQGRILLAGSSSIARWSSAASDFAPYKIVNMAKSGTTMQQWSKWYKELIVPYKPEAVIWYVGGNDLWRRTTPAKTARLFSDTVKKLHKALPGTQIYFVSVYTNISRKSISKQILAYNKKVKQFCKTKDYITYIDLATKFNNSGKPLKKLLVDGLHPNEEGYKIWKKVITPKVKNDMKLRGMAADHKEDSGKENTVVNGTNTENTGISEAGSDSSVSEVQNNTMIITGMEQLEGSVTGELNHTILK